MYLIDICCLRLRTGVMSSSINALIYYFIAFTATRSGAIDMARSTGILRESRCYLDSSISGLQERALRTFSSLRVKESLGKVVDLPEMRTKMSFPNQCMDRLKQGIKGLLHPCKGMICLANESSTIILQFNHD